MVILDTNHISILERRGPDAYPLLVRLADIPVSDVRVTVISYEEQIRGWTAAIAFARSGCSLTVIAMSALRWSPSFLVA